MKKKPVPFLGITARWKQVDPTGEPCQKCQEPIYGQQFIHETTVFMRTEVTGGPLCENCYLEVIKPDE